MIESHMVVVAAANGDIALTCIAHPGQTMPLIPVDTEQPDAPNLAELMRAAGKHYWAAHRGAQVAEPCVS